jgi:AcrR family transcriptional regulator
MISRNDQKGIRLAISRNFEDLKKMAVTDISARERILNAADELFYKEGIRVSGVDTIIEASGIAKTTFYRHFPSKDSLIVAYLQEREKKYEQVIQTILSKNVDSARQQLMDLFEFATQFVSNPRNRGCPFINCAIEFPDPTHPGHQMALSHKRRILTGLIDLCRRAKAKDPVTLARQLMIIYDGIIMAALQFRVEAPLSEGLDAVKALIDIQIPASAETGQNVVSAH